MKTDQRKAEQGSVLITTMMTITILTMICATSLYVASQNATGGMQTAAWQQSLTGAESGVDRAIRALNTGTWTNWKTVNTATLPTTEPASGTGSSASAVPTSSQYNYLPSSALALTMQGEGATSVSTWVTVDTAGANLTDSSGNQWYRIRSTGQSNLSGPARVSANKLDNNLRNTIALNFNRNGGSKLGPWRTIEVIMQPLVTSGWPAGITLGSWVSMSGGGIVDSFNSHLAAGGLWSLPNRITPQISPLVDSMNTSGQGDLRNTYVYGGINYSGPAVKNTTNVQGQISTPDNAIIYPTLDPVAQGSAAYNWTYQTPSGSTNTYSWTSQGGGGGNGTYPPVAGTYATLNGGGGLPTNGGSAVNSVTANGTASSPELIIINGDFTVSGSNQFTINENAVGSPATPSPTNSYVTIWVKGKFTTSGSGIVVQANGTHVTWIVDNDITVSGSSYNNQGGLAANTSFIGVSGTQNNGQYQQQHNITVSGQATFIGTIDAPGAQATVSGSGGYSGALIANTLTLSGSASFHYDTALSSSGGSSIVGNYAFASWFEDNSDRTRNITY
jgi:hypothetical protein